VADLRNRQDSREVAQEDHEIDLRRYREEIESLKRAFKDSQQECESHKVKVKQVTTSLGSLEGELAILHLQLKKKEDRIRALEEEIYLEKNRFCNLELDLKKNRLEAELVERNYKDELTLLQRRLATA
jgi:predicted  nucleic acid-binding Zn-ribbon protein